MSNHRSATNALRALGYHVTSRVRCAARFARLTGCSIYEAAQMFGLNAGAVHNAWSRIYPTRPHPVADRHKRPTCTACGQTGHFAVRGQCSPSQLALQFVASGATVIEAANRFGLTKQAVYCAMEHRRRAA